MTEDYYETSDLALATALQVEIEPIWKINKEKKKAVFIFRKTKALEEAIDKYWRKELKVSPLTYFNELKNIKSRLYD